MMTNRHDCCLFKSEHMLVYMGVTMMAMHFVACYMGKLLDGTAAPDSCHDMHCCQVPFIMTSLTGFIKMKNASVTLALLLAGRLRTHSMAHGMQVALSICCRNICKGPQRPRQTLSHEDRSHEDSSLRLVLSCLFWYEQCWS